MALILATQIVSVLFKCCELRKMARRRLYLVELFAGCHSVSRCVRRCFGKNLDVRILSVDNDPASNPTILVNINRWQYKPDIDEFLGNRRAKDIVSCWTSPPCTAFSRANSTGVRDIAGGIRNVKSGPPSCHSAKWSFRGSVRGSVRARKRLVYYLFRKGLLACGNGLRCP